MEIGGGTGLVSITASKIANHVTVTDINPHAIKCIKNNIKLNNVKNIKVLESNLFENITEQAGDYLNENGKIQMVQSSFSDNEKILHYLNNNGYHASITANIHQFFEDITLITAEKRGNI